MTEKLKKADVKVKKTTVRRVRKKTADAVALRKDIVKILDDGKAEDIKVIDLKGKSSMADYIVIASGTSSRHIYALADNIGKKLKADYKIKPIVEGRAGSDWVVIDAYDVIIHIFHPDARAFYDIEEIWQ